MGKKKIALLFPLFIILLSANTAYGQRVDWDRRCSELQQALAFEEPNYAKADNIVRYFEVASNSIRRNCPNFAEMRDRVLRHRNRVVTQDITNVAQNIAKVAQTVEQDDEREGILDIAQSLTYIEQDVGNVAQNTAILLNITKKAVQGLTEVAQRDEQILKQILEILNRLITIQETIQKTLNENVEEEEVTVTPRSYFPFGVHQWRNGEIPESVFIGLGQASLLGLSVWQLCRGIRNNRGVKTSTGHTADTYTSARNLNYIIAASAVAAAALWMWADYCVNFRRVRRNVSLSPILIPDWQGQPQMTMLINVQF